MARPLEWAEPALDEFAEALRFIAIDSLQAAVLVRERIESAAKRIVRRPFLYRQGLIPGTRECVVGGTSHTLIFEVLNDRIVILHCWHQRRQHPAASAD